MGPADSGGFQVFSLAARRSLDDDGVTFKSTYDGSTHRFTPEVAVTVQERIGADIAMVLDVCPPLPSPPETIRHQQRELPRTEVRVAVAGRRRHVGAAAFSTERRHSSHRIPGP